MTRVLQVVGSLRVGGLETVAMNCMRYSNKEKYQFDFLVLSDSDGEYEKEAIAMGCNIIHIKKTGRTYIEYYKELCRIMIDNGPYDIVHSHVYFNSGIVMLAAMHCGVPLRIAHAHSVKRKNDNRIDRILFRKGMQYLLKKYSTKICACSQKAGEYVFTSKFFLSKGIILPNSIDVDSLIFDKKGRERIRRELNIQQDCHVIGQIGHLTESKNQLFLLELFLKYKEKHKNSILLLVGDGELKDIIIKKIDELGLKEDVRLTGTRTDIRNLLSAMDVYVCTSTNEGFGITLLEAASNGLQIIVEKNVLVSELKKYISYYEIVGFDKNKWAQVIYDAIEMGRSKNECLKSSPYSVKTFCKELEQLYSI